MSIGWCIHPLHVRVYVDLVVHISLHRRPVSQPDDRSASRRSVLFGFWRVLFKRDGHELEGYTWTIAGKLPRGGRGTGCMCRSGAKALLDTILRVVGALRDDVDVRYVTGI